MMRAKWHSILRASLRSRAVISVSTFTVCEAKEVLSYDLRRSLDEIATVFRCRDATVLEDYPYMKILSSTLVHLQQLRPEFGRHLRLWLSNIVGAKMMIDFEGWDVGYADARNGQPSQCPTNVDPISYLSGYREGCSPDRAHTSLSVQMKRGWIR